MIKRIKWYFVNLNKKDKIISKIDINRKNYYVLNLSVSKIFIQSDGAGTYKVCLIFS